MLDKRIRKKFLENKFETIKKKDGNWSQTRIRLRDQVKKALNDIGLLATRLPDDEFEDIFTPKIIEEFVKDMIHDVADDKLDAKRTRLAAIFVRHGLYKCIIQYGIIEDQKPIRGPTEKFLNETISIASSIVSKVESQKTN